MAGNTKYQPAPQRDSFEESSYTQAPPSYQAESSHQDTLLAGPRGEDDNVPDDFKVRSNNDMTLNISADSLFSSEAQSQKRPSPYACSSSEKSMPYCKTAFRRYRPAPNLLIHLEPSKSLPRSSSAPCPTSPQATRTGYSQTNG